MAMQKRRASQDLVKEQGKLVVQVMKERASALEWENKWGFYKNQKQYLEEEANRLGWSKEEYWSTIYLLNPKPIKRNLNESSPSNTSTYPKTSSGIIGWRYFHELENRYQPAIPPLPKLERPNVIFLG